MTDPLPNLPAPQKRPYSTGRAKALKEAEAQEAIDRELEGK